MYMIVGNKYSLAISVAETDLKQKCISKPYKNMAVMISDYASTLQASLRIGFAAQQSLKHHHVQSQLGPSFYHPKTPLACLLTLLESFDKNNPEMGIDTAWQDRCIKRRCSITGSA